MVISGLYRMMCHVDDAEWPHGAWYTIRYLQPTTRNLVGLGDAAQISQCSLTFHFASFILHV